MIGYVQTGALLVCLSLNILMIDFMAAGEACAGSDSGSSLSADLTPAIPGKSEEHVFSTPAAESSSESAGSGETAETRRAEGDFTDQAGEIQAPRRDIVPDDQEKKKGEEQQTPETPSKEETEGQKPETIVDVLHEGISRGIQGTATWMDSFFGDRRYVTELNQSYIRFRYNVFIEDRSKLLRKPDFEFRMVLPQLREKTHLVFTGSPREASEFSAIQANTENEQITTSQERNVSAAVHQTLRETTRDNVIIRAGLQFHGGRPGIMLGPRYRILFPLYSWNLRFVEEVLWRSSTGWEAKSTVDLERPLPNGLFFRATNEWLWKEHVDGYLYAFVFHLGQPINHRRGLEYQWVNVFQTQPVNELTEVAVRVRYRQQFWRDWLYFDVSPQYRFPRDRSFHATPGILFRIEMIFGNYR